LASTFDCGWRRRRASGRSNRLGAVSRIPLAETLRTARRQVVVGFGVVAAVTTTFNIFFVFLPSYLATTGRAPLPRALAAALVGLVVVSTVAPGFGRISDRVGRRPVLITGVLALLLLTLPAFSLVQRGKTGGLLVAYSLMGLALGTFALSSFLAELFPTRLRYSGLSLSYGLASALFGGTAPALATLLVRRAGGALLPAWYATCKQNSPVAGGAGPPGRMRRCGADRCVPAGLHRGHRHGAACHLDAGHYRGGAVV
jgi:MHS family proline/betaine transporter-like MFS transporter